MNNEEHQHTPVFLPPDTPAFKGVIWVYLLSSLLLVFLGSFFQHLHLLSGLIISEIAFVVAPAYLYTVRNGYDISRTFHLFPIRLKTSIIVVMIAFAAFTLVGIVAAVQEVFLPRSSAYLEIWEAVLQKFHQVPLVITLLIVAVLPGVCEELLFRGFLLHGVRKRFSDTASIIFVGVLFGAFHLDPYRFLPVSLLGILFGYMVIKTGSIFTGMIAHATNNAIAMLISYAVYKAQKQDLLPVSSQSEELFTLQNLIVLLPIVAIALTVLVIGLRALSRSSNAIASVGENEEHALDDH